MPEKIYSGGPGPTYPRISAFEHLFSFGTPDSTAIIDATTGHSLTRASLKSQCLQLAYSLHHTHSLQPSSTDAVLLFSPNHLLYPVAYLGCFAAGIPVATASAASVPTELVNALKLTECSFFIVHPSLIRVFESAMSLMGRKEEEYMPRTVLLVEKDEGIPEERRRYGSIQSMMSPERVLDPVRFDGEDANKTCVYLFSSGTTGLPKAIALSHRAIVVQGEATKLWGVFREGDVLASPLPLFHVAAATLNLFLALMLGGTCVTWSSFTFDSFLGGLARCKANATIFVPPILAGFHAHPSVLKTDLSNLRVVTAGAAPISALQLQATYERIKSIAHPELVTAQGFGMSETCAVAVYGHRAQPPKWDSVGKPAPGVELRLVRDDGTDAENGEAGEIWMRGDLIMNEYLNNPQATAETITSDGWLKTGDIGTVDEDGYFYVVDRKKELIKYKGYQVPPAELEAVLLQHPAIADACVIGVPTSDGTDEIPKAFVSLRDPSFLGSQTLPVEIADWVKPRVSHYKALRGGVVLVKNIPRSASGKILRRELREVEKKSGTRRGLASAQL